MTEVSVFCLVGEATNLVRHQSSTSASVKATHSPLESSTVKARSTGCLISLMARCSKGACAHCSAHAIAPGGKCIFSQIPHHFMKNGLWMFRKKNNGKRCLHRTRALQYSNDNWNHLFWKDTWLPHYTPREPYYVLHTEDAKTC